MQIEISPAAEATLRTLASSVDTPPEKLVELAIAEMAERQEPLPDQFRDPVSGEVFSADGLQQRVAAAEASVTAGEVRTVDIQQTLAESLQRHANRAAATE